MLNNKFDTWTFIKTDNDYPPDSFSHAENGKIVTTVIEVYILIEHDVIGDGEDDTPFVRHARLEKEPDGFIKWILLDYDPETEEQVLQQCFTVVAWRFV